MEQAEAEKSNSSEETCQLSRNRSFKSKQLVRSQAIRESQSPPRTASPSVVGDVIDVNVIGDVIADAIDVTMLDPKNEMSSQSDVLSDVTSDYNDECKRKQPVEIQITSGTWEESGNEQRQRTKRWLGHKQHSRDLLSNNPRVACVCGACNACPHCRGRRRRNACPTKQDSGIVCSDDCPDCSDSEATGGSSTDGARKSSSLDVDDQTFYCRCPERKEKPKNISLSRTDSDEKSEPTGPELVKFIKDTLNKNARDRMTLLKIEKELHALVNDTGRCIVRFPVMTSYGRMLVHRVAALFQLSHHLDQINKTSVLVSKSGTSGGRIPCTSFKKWCIANFPPSPLRHMYQSDAHGTHARSILKRDTRSLDDTCAGSLSASRSKSLEQREREYERVRRRIFSTDNCTQDESQWQWLNSGPIKLLTPEGGRNKLLKVQSLEGNSVPSSGVATSPRGPVSKSHSFGGYGRVHDTPRLLSRQGDLASSSWRLSPSSSGYRTLSLHSTDSVTPSPTGGASPEPSGPEGVAVVWAVTDLSAVPPGAVVIHPQTGRPLTNPDGSVYHFDPNNPPILTDANVYQQTIDINSEKKRGRLEKQQSFIDNECECQPSEECRGKCCECRRHDTCHRTATEKVTNPQEQKVHQIPTSPCKNRYEPPVEPPTSHNTTSEIPANNKSTYETATNQKQATENTTNQRQAYELPIQSFNASPNQRQGFEMPARTYETTNQRPDRHFENQRPPSYETNQKYEPTNQRASVEVANHRAVKLSNQGTPEVQYLGQQFQQGFSQEEQGTTPQASSYGLAEMGVQALAQVKPQIQDPNLRQLPLGVMYPPAQYPFSPLPVYQPVVEEQKQVAASPHTDHTFRIDPSYPYAPAEFPSQCTACVEPAQRPYTLYTPVDHMMQYPLQHYPYQEQVQWQNIQPLVQLPNAQPQKLFVPDVYPIVQYPTVYPQYNVMYPQMVPAPYGVCPPLLSQADCRRAPHRNSAAGSSRNTPLQTPPDDKKVPYEETTHAVHQPHHGQNTLHNQPEHSRTYQNIRAPRQDSNEIAATIQQIKEQMAQLNMREREKNTRGREEWRRRNSGNGILGSYPVNNFNGRVVGRTPADDQQLSSAARAIVNSIRNMQAKNNYHDRRTDYNQYRNDKDRPDYRPRRPDDKDRPDERRPLPLHYRPSYLLRQMSPGAWCRRSPGPVHPVLNQPRRPHPDSRNARR